MPSVRNKTLVAKFRSFRQVGLLTCEETIGCGNADRSRFRRVVLPLLPVALPSGTRPLRPSRGNRSSSRYLGPLASAIRVRLSSASLPVAKSTRPNERCPRDLRYRVRKSFRFRTFRPGKLVFRNR